MYFDAAQEAPCLRALTKDEKLDRLDKLGSVSELPHSLDKLDNQMDAFVLEGDGVSLEHDPSAPREGAGFVESMTFYMKGD
jgi:hypothetical protein